MKNYQYADFSKKENAQESTNSLSKSADILSTRDLILKLNDSFISRKSKEYNFDFAKAASYDYELHLLNHKPSFSPYLNKKPEELNLIAKKTRLNLINGSVQKIHTDQNSFFCKNIKDTNFEKSENKKKLNNQLNSKQIIRNFFTNSSCDSISKIKERLQLLQKKKIFEILEAKNQKHDLTTRDI